MPQLRHQQIFAPKLRLVTKKKRPSTMPPARRLDAEIFLSNPQIRTQLEQALSSQMEKAYNIIVEGKTRRPRVYRRCWGISMVVNVVAWIGFFIWVVMPKQVPLKIEDDIISVTFLSPDMLPKPKPRLYPVPQPLPPVEEPPPPVEEQPDQPVVDPLEIDPLLKTAEDTRTQDTAGEAIVLDTLQQSLPDEESRKTVETDLAYLSPLQSRADSVPQGFVKPAVEFRPLRGKGKGESFKPSKVTPTASKVDLNLQTLPKLLTPISPKFPPVESIQTCTVVLRLWVETNGATGKIHVHKVTPTMDERKERAFRFAAIEAAKDARFAPASRDGKPVRLSIQISIWFERSEQQSYP